MYLKSFPLLCYTISKTMNILQNNIFDDNELFQRFLNFELISYDTDNYCLSFLIQLDSTGTMKKEKNIFTTNLFDIMIEVFDNDTIEIGFLNHKLNFLIDELNHKTTLTIQDLQLKFKYLTRKPILNIVPLSDDTLSQANKLRDSIFLDISDIEKDTLTASLNKNKYFTCFKDNKIRDMKYYVSYTHDKKVAGLIGLYEEISDAKDMCWIGWFCVDKRYRGFQIGKNLLDFIIEKAKSINKTMIHLYTYDADEFQKAKEIYLSYGFEQYKPNFNIDKKDLYFKLKII